MSTKVPRLLEVDPVGMADWANLQTDIVCTIIRKLAIPDYIRFRAVCASWNCICRDVSNHPRTDPWLMMPAYLHNGSKFFSIPERKNQIVKIPSTSTIFGYMWSPVGSSRGWLIYFNESHGTMQLVNPISGAHIGLPPIGRKHFSKALLLDMNEGNFTVAVIYGDQKGFKMTRKGSTNWSFVESKHILVDVLKHRRQLYTIDIYGTIEVWAEPPRAWPDEYDDTMQVNHDLHNLHHLHHLHHNLVHSRQQNSLVETPAGDLIRVKRQSQSKFALWTLNKETSSFERTDDIGEFGLFVSHYSSFCFPAKHHPNLKANCIYFIDDFNNLCAFNLEPGTKELVQSLESDPPQQEVHSGMWHLPFLWFIPSLK